MSPLAGKSAFVTGGASGIGLATVKALSGLGAKVTFTARNPESQALALRQLQGCDAKPVLCDITNHSRMREIATEGFDILVNNAAIIDPIGRITDIQLQDFSDSLAVNVTAQFAATQFVLPHMIAKGGGTIVNISSGAAHKAKEGWTAYCVGKAALAMLTKSIDHEYRAEGIRCFGIAPGVVDTQMQVKIRASGMNPVSRIPREQLSPSDEPARAIAWLCTSEADPFIGGELDIRDPALRAAIGF